MKKTILAIVLPMLAFSSCEKWLAATSSTQFQAETIYETAEGFHDALSGVYINMGSLNAYGGNATWRYNDLVVYPYSAFTTAKMANFQRRNYQNSFVKDEIFNTWLAFYNCLANVNIILDNIDSHRSVFSTQSEFNWVKGECLALRAYLHFDLLRMFGSEEWSGENAGKLTIPYVTSYSRGITPQLSYAETEKLLFEDMETALELLGDDPIRGKVPDNFGYTVNADGYWDNRTTHLNYLAVKALFARVYQWKHEYAVAGRMAKEALDEALEAAAVSWVDVDAQLAETSNDRKDWTFLTEHLFSLEVTGLYNNAANCKLIPIGSSTAGDDYKLDKTFYDVDLFGSMSLSSLEDRRGTAFLLHYFDGQYVSYKLFGTGSAIYRNRMPMVKLSELYYIAAEAAALEGDYVLATDYINEVRRHRGISSDMASSSKVLNTLHLEYMKEFINEGQYFYWLKHSKLQYQPDATMGTSPIVSNPIKEQELVFPYPDEEIHYGRKQEL